MNQVYLAEFIQFLCLLPAAAICFLPVKNQLKYSAKTTAGIAAGGIASLSLAGVFSTLSLGVNADLVFFAAIIMCFVFYYRMVKCGLGEKLAIFFLYLFVLSGMFLLMLIIYVSFYFVAMELIQSLDQRERIQLMQMREHQYIAQQTYIEESSRIRHDFRQSAITMLSLAEQNDVEALKNYLQSFVADLPQNEIRAWCRNPSVNALLNYYETLLEMYGVRRQWEISLPDCKISDNDLCGMLGNLLENVYHGCLTAKEGERFHHFSLLLKNERDLYIVSTNSFDDEVRKKDGKYASSRKDGSGIGLSSIRITAEKYNGTARFSHDDKVFYIDVVMEV
ncbi:MAG: GHKL domain-containing protein [Clostridia bacterium]